MFSNCIYNKLIFLFQSISSKFFCIKCCCFSNVPYLSEKLRDKDFYFTTMRRWGKKFCYFSATSKPCSAALIVYVEPVKVAWRRLAIVAASMIIFIFELIIKTINLVNIDNLSGDHGAPKLLICIHINIYLNIVESP